MKKPLLYHLFLPAILLLIPVALGAATHDDASKEHILLQPDKLQWKDGPPSLPPGTEFAVLEGDPAQEGMVTFRIRAPAGYQIPPHTHPRVERVTVLEGEFKLGMGREFDEQKMETLPAGSFFAMPPEMAHYAATNEETVIELTVEGPWQIRYINPADDPRGSP